MIKVLCFPDKDHVCSATLNFTGTEIRVVGAYHGQLAPVCAGAQCRYDIFLINSSSVRVELDGETSGPIQPPKDEQFQFQNRL
jgi:hypothetical protein